MSWGKYRVGRIPFGSRNGDWDCLGFDEVYHIAHVETSMAIVRERMLKPQLVFDESKLKKKRILVNWVSPNFYQQGSIYGHVRFHLDWKQLIRGKHYYWVESMPYEPEALRILITPRDRSETNGITPYDPARRDGPWWFDEENDHITFVRHKANICSTKGNACTERDMLEEEAAGRFTAGLIANKLSALATGLKAPGLGSPVPVGRGRQYLIEELANDLPSRKDPKLTAQQLALGRAILNAYFQRSQEEVEALSSLIEPQILANCIRALVNRLFEKDKLSGSARRKIIDAD